MKGLVEMSNKENKLRVWILYMFGNLILYSFFIFLVVLQVEVIFFLLVKQHSFFLLFLPFPLLSIPLIIVGILILYTMVCGYKGFISEKEDRKNEEVSLMLKLSIIWGLFLIIEIIIFCMV